MAAVMADTAAQAHTTCDMAQQSKKVVVIGAGLTGAVLHHLLRKSAPKLSVQVWEKASFSGGRYDTTSLANGTPSSATRLAGTQTGTACADNLERPTAHADLGAQYVTAFEPKAHGHYYEALAAGGVLQEISPGLIHGGRGSHSDQKHWSAPAGIAGVPKFFLGDAAVHFGRELHSLSVSDNATWRLTDKSGQEEHADAVVLTCTMPPLLGLEGTVQDSLGPYKSDLEKVSYSSRFAMGLCYSSDAWAALEKVAWSGKYFSPSDSDVIVWISISGLDHTGDVPRASTPAGQEQQQGPTIAVHTTVPYGLKNGQTPRDDVRAKIMEHLAKVVPELAGLVPVETHLLYWECSQVYKGYKHEEEARPAVLEVSRNPSLLLAGDAFTKSGFDGCIDSAEAACEIITGTRVSGVAMASEAGVDEQNSRAAM